MTALKTALLAAAAAMILTSGWQYQVRQQRSDEVANLRAENDQLRLLASQRHESPVAPSRAKEEAMELPEASSGRSGQGEPKGTRLVSKDVATAGVVNEYRKEGTATPLAALQTLAWACDQADATLMETLLIYDEDARQKTLEHFASISAKNSAKLPSIDAAAAAIYIEDGMHHPYPGAKILELAKFEQIRPDRVRLHLPGANGDGYEFQLTAEGWKLAITLAVVDDYIRQSAKPASKP
jgi:hypothetical protein